MRRDRQHRFGVALSATLLAASVALLYATPTAFLLAIVPLGYVVYGSLSSYPDPTVAIERSVSPAVPAPGTVATVTLTVTNTGQRLLSDVRVVDGVPDELAVVSGSPRGSLSIPAGEARTITYGLMAMRGEYDFEATTVRVRSLSGSRLVTTTPEVSGTETLTCSTSVERTPLRRTTRSRTGTFATESGGEGLEFHSTREYRSGDPMSRIDWRRFARTDDLSTIDFREEHATRLVIVVDARPSTRQAPHPGYPTGAELSAYAGERAYDALTTAGHQVGVTALGVDAADRDAVPTVDGVPWVRPPSDGGSETAARALFDAAYQASDRHDTDRAFVADGRGSADDAEAAANRLRTTLPPDAQVLLLTPLLDHVPRSLASSIELQGVAVTVLSPNVTSTGTLGGRVTRLQRRNRARAIRENGTTVVDWTLTDPLDVALQSALRPGGNP